MFYRADPNAAPRSIQTVTAEEVKWLREKVRVWGCIASNESWEDDDSAITEAHSIITRLALMASVSEDI